jgi:magnesium transporter
VSFPPGGQQGGVDIGTWDEEDESEAASNVNRDELFTRFEDEPLPMDVPQSVSSEEAIGMERVSSRDPSSRPLSVEQRSFHHDSHDANEGDLSPETRISHLRRQTEPVIPSSTSDEQSPQSPTSPTSAARRRPTLHQGALGHYQLTSPRQSFPPHSLSPGPPSGFSIGLSPVSPGFSLIPRERGRRRRVTSVEGDSRLLGSSTGRRALSSSSAAPGENAGNGDEQAVSPRTEGDIEEAGLHVGGAPSRSRWKWLSSLIVPRENR